MHVNWDLKARVSCGPACEKRSYNTRYRDRKGDAVLKPLLCECDILQEGLARTTWAIYKEEASLSRVNSAIERGVDKALLSVHTWHTYAYLSLYFLRAEGELLAQQAIRQCTKLLNPILLQIRKAIALQY